MVSEVTMFDPVGACTLFFILGLCFLIVVWICTPRKTKQYRRELGDMYVASKIRKIAQDENFDLSEEYNRFRQWAKKKKLESLTLNYDDVVEEEMKEQVEDQLSKKEKKK